ncbi:TRAP transporter substrate-binding protein [Niallia sp. Krafla_26]|uniref:TRAP transporter substrate-binding protein n=1 Tax=Niallia sp. Krafla_26 TaxID=3064703 RepID=UPI003D180378
MNLRKIVSAAAVGVLSLSLLSACNNTIGAAGNEKVTLHLASNHPEEHPVTPSLREFAQLANEKSGQEVEVKVAANGLLGGERDVIELVKSGTLQMAKVSASALEGFEKSYSIFSLPYVFQSEEHYYNVMENSEAVHDIFTKTKDQGWFAIGWYSGGQRSIYTANTKVESTEDMKGMKIRVQESPTSISMIKAMGGSPTPMAFGEVYTSLQQGIIDGAENNEMGLTSNKHGEVAKAYTYTEHQYVPDVLIMSTEAWEGLTDEQKDVIIESAVESAESHKVRWEKAVIEATKEAEDMGVQFYQIDKQPFIDAAKPLHEQFKAKNEDNARYFDDFQSYVK